LRHTLDCRGSQLGILAAGRATNRLRRLACPHAAALSSFGQTFQRRVDPRERHALSEFEPVRQINDPAATHTQTRRNCLRACVGLLGALSIQSRLLVPKSQSELGNLEHFLRRIGGDLAGDRRELSRLGAIYIASNPQERYPRQLSRLLSNNGPNPIALSLVEKIARDWLKHDVTVVDDWILARTEARICALLHLTDGARA
jgi:hypothetical protein